MTRRDLCSRMFPKGIPALWCPLITHFLSGGTPDLKRIGIHLKELSHDVRGLLIPGSTGEGWDMTDDDILQLIEGVLPHITSLGQHLLIGALKPTAEETLSSIESTLGSLKKVTGIDDDSKVLQACNVVGFTVCPPRGEDLSQECICRSLEKILERSLPTAIYQLPQVTGNEMSPLTVSALAETYQNFFLFKDTSGTDAAALSGLDFQDVFFVRGAEGQYSRWHSTGGGPYDGFLLSTANSFSRELGLMLRYLNDGKQDEADDVSRRITACVEKVFPLAGEVKAGNAFANANKIFDHLRAWGHQSGRRPAPMLYGGMRLDKKLIEAARNIMEEMGFDLSRGYMLEDQAPRE